MKKQQKLARLIKKGKLREAILILRPLCRQRPYDPQGWMSLASLHGQLGDYQGVLDACKEVVKLQPRLPLPYSLMGNALACLGRFEEAGEQYKKAMELRPNDPGILNNLGNALYLEGKLEEAAEPLEHAVKLQPNYADAHNNLGNIYKALNDNNRAIHHYQRAVQIQPDLFEAHINLGNIFITRIGHPEAAEQHYREARRIKPDDIEANAGVANVLRYLGDMDGAMEVIKNLQRLYPGEASALAGEADILERLGKKEEAYRLARRLADEKTSNPMAVDVLLRVCQRFDYCNEAAQRAECLLESDTLAPTGEETLHFGLGKLYDRRNDYDRAFEHYRAANEVGNIPFDPGDYVQRVDDLIEAFSEQALALLPRSTIGSRQPLFIVGMPRSGTSLTEQILASHPDVAAAGELNEINDITASIRGYPRELGGLTSGAMDDLARRYLDFTAACRADESFVTDKMPHNFMNLGLIALLFPDSKIIQCTRDPRDNCLSIYFQSFGWVHPYGTRLEWLGAYYREYLRMMKHWKDVLEQPILTVQYEKMVKDQETVTRQILDYCGLEWNDACLDFHKSERVVATASYDQVRQKMYTKSRARWKNYSSHLEPLIDSLGDSLENWPVD